MTQIIALTAGSGHQGYGSPYAVSAMSRFGLIRKLLRAMLLALAAGLAAEFAVPLIALGMGDQGTGVAAAVFLAQAIVAMCLVLALSTLTVAFIPAPRCPALWILLVIALVFSQLVSIPFSEMECGVGALTPIGIGTHVFMVYGVPVAVIFWRLARPSAIAPEQAAQLSRRKAIISLSAVLAVIAWEVFSWGYLLYHILC